MDQPLFLASLQKGREKRAIVVRVVRKYVMTESQGSGEPMYVGMVLADAQGQAIYAEIPKQHMEKKASMFEIGEICMVQKFVVKGNKSNFKVLERPLMIEISQHTMAEAVVDPPRNIPERVYTLTDFSAIVPSDGPIVQYTDVIGYLIKYTEVNTFVPKNRERVTMLRELYIKDLSERELKVTIWGDYATNFNINHVYDEKAGNIVVCLILGCAPRREFRDYNKIYLSGSQPFCYYLNPRIPEAEPYYTRFKNRPIFIERPPVVDNPVNLPIQNVTLQLKTVAELNAIEDPYNFEDGSYKCTVIITSVVDTNRWWYMACKLCKKKAIQQFDGSYRCVNCNGTKTAARYLLTFMARDDTAEARFFAHDTEAKIIVGKDCEAVMNPLNMTGGFPQQLLNIVDKKYTFSIDLEDEPIRQYVVKAVLVKPPRRPIQPSAIAESSATSALLVHENIAHEAGTSASVEHSKGNDREILELQDKPYSPPPTPGVITGSGAEKGNPGTDIPPGEAGHVRRSLTFPEESGKDKETMPVDKSVATGTISDDDGHSNTSKRLRSGSGKQGTKTKSARTGQASS